VARKEMDIAGNVIALIKHRSKVLQPRALLGVYNPS
jgi:hypothetical protein